MASENVTVWVVTDPNPNVVLCSKTFTAEDLCIHLCKKHNIPPLTRTLFALRVKGTELFLKDNNRVVTGAKEYELRIRFKVASPSHLKDLDETTYDYYFQQARNDVNDNQVPEIKYPDHKDELMGLGITDMYRAILEEELALGDVERHHRRYLPKIIVRKHGMFARKRARDTIRKLCEARTQHDPNFVKSQYLQHLHTIAPNYLAERYDGVSLDAGGERLSVAVEVAPYHRQQRGLRLRRQATGEWEQVCTIDDLLCLTRHGDHRVEVSRSGTPLFLRFRSEAQLASFISVCDGYFRLMVKWTFNLSKEDETPSLIELHTLKSHGPVGGAFSYRKLQGKDTGCYVLRQCQEEYDVFYLDVCIDDGTIKTFILERSNIENVIKRGKNFMDDIYLKQCIPPSENDKSQALLCSETQKRNVRVEPADLSLQRAYCAGARCISIKHILLFDGSEKMDTERITATHKALWKLDETKRLEVAFKTLQGDRINEHLRGFIDIANKWSCLQPRSIVRLYGVILSSPTAMVLEYMPYGPLTDYLRNNKEVVKPVHLLEAAASLSWALFHLSEERVVHGFLRCRKLMVAAHADRMLVKLGCPSLRPYRSKDKPWLPPEHRGPAGSADADVWAFATTLWEVFSYGASPHVVFTNGCKSGRLRQPARCPPAVWAIVLQCQHPEPSSRARPQAIMRDMNYLLASEYAPQHHYEHLSDNYEIRYETKSDSLQTSRSRLSEAGSRARLLPDERSGATDDHYDDSSDNLSAASDEAAELCAAELSGAELSGADYAPPERPCVMKPIFSHEGKEHYVTFHYKIGQGTYGTVYKGWIDVATDAAESQRTVVAIKKLSRRHDCNVHSDATNELDIMKSLHHPNIVTILGSWSRGPEVGIVMEYLEQGSLESYFKSQDPGKVLTEHLLKYALDIANGMEHVSAQGIVHRDLAARNILVLSKQHVKITDFGLARLVPPAEGAYRVKSPRQLPINWYAPEAATAPYLFSQLSDVWSYGVTVWEIFTRKQVDVPDFDQSKPRERANAFIFPKNCPTKVIHLVKDCWQVDPHRRPHFREIAAICRGLLDSYCFEQSNS